MRCSYLDHISCRRHDQVAFWQISAAKYQPPGVGAVPWSCLFQRQRISWVFRKVSTLKMKRWKKDRNTQFFASPVHVGRILLEATRSIRYYPVSWLYFQSRSWLCCSCELLLCLLGAWLCRGWSSHQFALACEKFCELASGSSGQFAFEFGVTNSSGEAR